MVVWAILQFRYTWIPTGTSEIIYPQINQWMHRLCLGMDKKCYPTLCNGYDYLLHQLRYNIYAQYMLINMY